jgi:two-component system, NtrC family, response regulator
MSPVSKILIIDDNRSLCKMLSQMLEQMGHHVACKFTMADGRAEVGEKPYDVVFLDMNLPDGNGLDLLPAIRRTPSSPEVIIITGFGDEESAEIAIRNGAWDYIQKTDSPSKIMLPLRQIFQYRHEKKKEYKTHVALNIDGIIGRGPRIKCAIDLLAQAASTDVSVLLTGETGTGKELFAKAIYKNSKRANGSFVVVDCSALPETLVEGILFGHKKGSYTGAEYSREGLVSQAHGGTLFLDEIGELPLAMQKVFLRVLQEHRFRPIGSREEISSDFRLVAATNQDLDQLVAAGRFRSDLLYRLRTLEIHLPPLREQTEDIAEIALYHVKKYCERNCIRLKGLSPDFLEILFVYPWMGNVRELVKTMEAALIRAGSGGILFPNHLPEQIRIHVARSSVRKKAKPENEPGSSDASISLKDFRKIAAAQAEKAYLQDLLAKTGNDIDAVCRLSGLSRSHFYALIKRHKISLSG